MQKLRRLSLAEQTAAHLRKGLRRGHWRGKLPGLVPLAATVADVVPGSGGAAASGLTATANTTAARFQRPILAGVVCMTCCE